jgi:hypothetical protein
MWGSISLEDHTAIVHTPGNEPAATLPDAGSTAARTNTIAGLRLGDMVQVSAQHRSNPPAP